MCVQGSPGLGAITVADLAMGLSRLKKCNTEVAASSHLGDKDSEKSAPMKVAKDAVDRRGSDASPADGQVSVSQECEKRDSNSTTEKGAFLHELVLLRRSSKKANFLSGLTRAICSENSTKTRRSSRSSFSHMCIANSTMQVASRHA